MGKQDMWQRNAGVWREGGTLITFVYEKVISFWILTPIPVDFKQKKTAFVRVWPAAFERQNHTARLSMSYAFIYNMKWLNVILWSPHFEIQFIFKHKRKTAQFLFNIFTNLFSIKDINKLFVRSATPFPTLILINYFKRCKQNKFLYLI
jgi:hypothetical protein